MGVTYSWLKRRSARAKSASPGATAGSPSVPRSASRTAWAAKIFSASVIGRGAWLGSSGASAPLKRARLYANSPPASTMAREIGESRLVKARELELFALFQALEKREVRAGQEPDVLTILQVDFLEARREHDPHATGELRVRRGLARAAAALARTADDHLEAAVAHRVARDDVAAQPDQAIARQRLVVVVAGPGRRQLVGRDVGHERARRIEGQPFAGQLRAQ